MEYALHEIEEAAQQFADRDFGDPEELVQYFLVNKDVKMGKGKVAAQVAHAACIYAYNFANDKMFQTWFHSIQKKIILKASQGTLEELVANRGLDQHIIGIYDKGYTQLEPNTLTVVTLGVRPRKEVDHIVFGLPLL